MSKALLVDSVAEKLGSSKADASKAIDAVLASIGKVTDDGGRITVPGFGTFRVKDRPARSAKNPRTGAAIEVPARSELAFKASRTKA
jgi:nucleoid DNA-binding protein